MIESSLATERLSSTASHLALLFEIENENLTA